MATASAVGQESENDRIRQRIIDIYADFVKSVDPTSYIMDLLYERRVINEEIAEQLRKKKTRQECCRSMLHELSRRGNPEAFTWLRTALQQDYRWIVEKIDQPTAQRSPKVARQTENTRILQGIMDMYKDFVKQVDPTGHVMDLLIQRRVIKEEDAEQLRKKKTKKKSCERMLYELLRGGNQKAFIVLRTALQEDYQYVVKKIDEPTTVERKPDTAPTETLQVKESGGPEPDLGKNLGVSSPDPTQEAATASQTAGCDVLRALYSELTTKLDARIVAVNMYQRNALTLKELQSIQSLRDRPVEAAETLLNIIMAQPARRGTPGASVYLCFLDVLEHIEQLHVSQWLVENVYEENKRIRRRIMDVYDHFVAQVEPTGHITDLLIQHRVIKEEDAEQLLKKRHEGRTL